jgi:hypothetical protein
LELDQLNLKGDTALVAQLAGKLDSKTAKPEEKTVSVDKLKNQQLPPYSLTVIRIQSGAK